MRYLDVMLYRDVFRPWGDADVVLSTTVAAAMLEERHVNSVPAKMCNYTPVEMRGQRLNFAKVFPDISILRHTFFALCIQYLQHGGVVLCSIHRRHYSAFIVTVMK